MQDYSREYLKKQIKSLNTGIQDCSQDYGIINWFVRLEWNREPTIVRECRRKISVSECNLKWFIL